MLQHIFLLIRSSITLRNTSNSQVDSIVYNERRATGSSRYLLEAGDRETQHVWLTRIARCRELAIHYSLYIYAPAPNTLTDPRPPPTHPSQHTGHSPLQVALSNEVMSPGGDSPVTPAHAWGRLPCYPGSCLGETPLLPRLIPGGDSPVTPAHAWGRLPCYPGSCLGECVGMELVGGNVIINSTVTDVTFREVGGHSNCPDCSSGTSRNLALCMRLANVQVYLVPHGRLSKNIYGILGSQKYVRDGRYFKKDMGKIQVTFFLNCVKPLNCTNKCLPLA